MLNVQVEKIRAVFDKIGETRGSNAKKEILVENAGNQDFLKVLQFVYNSNVVTGLAKRKMSKEFNDLPENKHQDLFSVLQFVKDNPTGQDNIIKTIQAYMKELTEENAKFVHDVLVKDFPIGISKSTLTKVYGEDFLETYGVQNAATYDPKKGLPEGTEFYLSPKSDGNRVTVHIDEKSRKILTRNNKELTGFVELDPYFDILPKGYSYDGEIVHVDSEYGKMEYFNEIQSICRSKGEKKNARFLVFDMIPLDEFNKGESTKTFKERRAMLESVMLDVNSAIGDLVREMPILYRGTDQLVIPKISEIYLERGYEGTMINDANAVMKRGRDSRLLKNKPFKTIDLRVIDVVEDIRGGKCGSVKVDYKGYDVNVSGLKDAQKVSWWNNPSEIVGKIIEIKYLHETKNANGTISLRHPSLLRIRDDKDEVSYS